MTQQFSNPLAAFTAPQPAVYRPKYRVRTGNPDYALNKTGLAELPEQPGLLDALAELERQCENPLSDEAGRSAVKWRPEKLTGLTLYLDNSLLETDWPEIFRKAAAEWQSAGSGLTGFTWTVRPDHADIVIGAQVYPVFGRENEVGHTDREVRGNWISRAKITVILHPAIQRHADAVELRRCREATALHELGHALGLEHSQNQRDVMYYRGWRNTGITANDARALKQLYAEPARTIII